MYINILNIISIHKTDTSADTFTHKHRPFSFWDIFESCDTPPTQEDTFSALDGFEYIEVSWKLSYHFYFKLSFIKFTKYSSALRKNVVNLTADWISLAILETVYKDFSTKFWVSAIEYSQRGKWLLLFSVVREPHKKKIFSIFVFWFCCRLAFTNNDTPIPLRQRQLMLKYFKKIFRAKPLFFG